MHDLREKTENRKPMIGRKKDCAAPARWLSRSTEKQQRPTLYNRSLIFINHSHCPPKMNTMRSTSISTLVAGATLLFAAMGAQAQAPAGDVKAGEAKAAMCIGCHGIVGYQNSFPEVHKVPKISGQSAPYIVAALTAYKKSERKHPTMRGMAASLSEQDMADLAAFYSGHAGNVVAAEKPSKEPPAAVKALLDKAACASCHGENFSKPIDPSYPKIAGQHADYLFVALKAYNVQNNPHVGRSNPIMGGITGQFKPAELKQIAYYLSKLDGELNTLPQPKFR
jgi:cytochrome c553